MSLAVDSDFSVYNLAEHIRDDNFHYIHRATMRTISAQLENVTRLDRIPTRIFAGFQTMSNFIYHVDRYREMAETAESIYIFGVPDVIPPEIEGIQYVYLKEQDLLSQEWFLISHSKNFASAVIAREINTELAPEEGRIFEGDWTFDTRMISLLVSWLSVAVKLPSLKISESIVDVTKQSQLISTAIQRSMSQVARIKSPAEKRMIQTELTELLEDQLFLLAQAVFTNQVQPELPKQDDLVILWAEIRAFNALSHEMDSTLFVKQVVNPFLNTVTQIVKKFDGKIDRYTGNGIVAAFGFTGVIENAIDQAIEASKNILNELGPNFPAVGIGIDVGPVHFGMEGAGGTYERTINGRAVETAQRLSSFGSNEIWISQLVYEKVIHPTDFVVKGVITQGSQQSSAYQLMKETESISSTA